MNLVFFAHPEFLGHKSMTRFTKLLSDGMSRRGHRVETWTPESIASSLTKKPFLQKWLGYYDLYVAFPSRVRRLLQHRTDMNTLFVFTDQSMGPWVPMLANRPNVIHCHDFLALRSALGEINENRTSWTGRIYQQYIRKGFSKGRNFISVSKKTKEDLEKLVLEPPEISEFVYNGLHQAFAKYDCKEARAKFSTIAGIDLQEGYLLHVGGNMWYKNRIGVIEIYNAWRELTNTPKPLVLVGAPLSGEAAMILASSKYRKDIYQLTEIRDEDIGLAYSGASLFLFPSLGEGFGWPIAEAMASGTLVVTTNEVPMSEVAGDAGYLIPRRPSALPEIATWAKASASTIENILRFSFKETENAINKGVLNAMRFNTEDSLDQIEALYVKVLERWQSKTQKL